MSKVLACLRRAAGLFVSATVLLAMAAPAWAQAVQISVSQTVVPAGAPVEVTLTGPPGQVFAVGGSSTGSGLTYGGVQLQLGLDAVVLAQGVIDGTGRVVVSVTPPFHGSVLDRYYMIGVAAPTTSFLPPNASSAVVVKNGDLLGGVIGPAGPQGPTGPAGPAGAVGPQGPAGPTGAQGPAGPAGVDGAAGATGPAGPQGPAGPAGPSGPAGADGAAGAVGPAGADGAQGAQGSAGPQGPVGPVGPVGPQGPAGADGAVGAIGPQGSTGAAGPQGPAGADGAVGPQGPAGPAGAEGAPGAVGPQGPAGPLGPMGLTGPAGPAGSQGATGAQGLPGLGAFAAVELGAGTTNSTTYTTTLGGATAGTNPSVTLDLTGTSAIVIVTAAVAPGNNQSGYVGVAVSGATTIAASDSRALIVTTGLGLSSAMHYVTGLTPGSNTFTLLYKVSGSSAQSFSARNLLVIPMP